MKEGILVTGGNGIIGKPLVERLLNSGIHEVVNVDKSPPVHATSENLIDIRADIRTVDYSEITKDVELQGIIHLAQESGERLSMSNVLKFHETNVTATLRLLEFARADNVDHVVLRSSGSAKTGKDRTPNSPYGATKLAAEKFAEVHARLHGMNISVLRVFDLYGVPSGMTSLQEVLDELKLSEPVGLPAGSATFYPVHLTDVVQAFEQSLRNEGFSVMELGSFPGFTVSDLISKAMEISGEEIGSGRVGGIDHFQLMAPESSAGPRTISSRQRFLDEFSELLG